MTSASDPLPPHFQLPLIPHPSSLIAPHEISAHLLEQAQRGFDQLTTLRRDVTNGTTSGYDLPPPNSSTLPPLPPILEPPKRLHIPRRSSLITPSSNPRPVIVPPLPAHLSDCRTPQECVEAYNAAEVDSKAILRSEGRAMAVSMKGVVVWVLLRSTNWDDEGVSRVQSVIVHVVKGEEVPPIHISPQTGPALVLSKHLSDLALTLPQLLHRLPAVPNLLDGSCFYCQKHLKLPDGLPLRNTGWVYGTKTWVGWHAGCDSLQV